MSSAHILTEIANDMRWRAVPLLLNHMGWTECLPRFDILVIERVFSLPKTPP